MAAEAMQTRRGFLKEAMLGAAALGGAGGLPSLVCRAAAGDAREAASRGTAEAGGKRRLSFVFVLVDDLGWADVGCNGSTFYETPNIDRLAAGGMRFTDAYAACPVCSPTRASIMTGKYPARLGLTNWLVGRIWPKHSPIRPVKWRTHMPLEEVTLAEAFKAAGYATGFFGKWHLGGRPYWPEKQGFDVNVAGCERGLPRTYFDPYRLPNLADRKKGEYLTDRLTEEAEKFLAANRDRPFLCYLSHYAVHTPLQAKQALAARYRAKAARMPKPPIPVFGTESGHRCRQVQNHPVFAGMIQSVDESVGRLVKKLDELGIADSTAVIFMSDNGGTTTGGGLPTSNLPLRAGKGWLYEGGIREPMIVKWPGVTRPGSTCAVPVTSTDFYPTMLAMAGLPGRPEQHRDGTSFAGLLKGEGKLDRDAIYWHYPHYSPQGGRPGGAVRAGDFKLIEFYEDGRGELYNLREDIGEKSDLAAKMPGKLAEMKRLLVDWRKSVGAQMPRSAAAGGAAAPLRTRT
jgi:arylsulfatase A-like enzyme